VPRVFKRKRALALVGATLACAAGAPVIVVPAPPPPPPPITWTLVWSDEFSGAAGAAIDTTKWRYDTGDGCPRNCGWGNNEKSITRLMPPTSRRMGWPARHHPPRRDGQPQLLLREVSL